MKASIVTTAFPPLVGLPELMTLLHQLNPSTSPICSSNPTDLFPSQDIGYHSHHISQFHLHLLMKASLMTLYFPECKIDNLQNRVLNWPVLFSLNHFFFKCLATWVSMAMYSFGGMWKVWLKQEEIRRKCGEVGHLLRCKVFCLYHPLFLLSLINQVVFVVLSTV